MIKALAFTPATADTRIREPLWIERSRIDVRQVCEIANEVRERVATHFGRGIEVWVHEPIAAAPRLIAALLAEAELFDVDAGVKRAWLFVDSRSARHFVAAAFAEEEPPPFRPWSPLERQTLRGIMHDIASCCTPLIGPVREVVASGDHAEPLAGKTLIALRFGAPLDIEIDLLLAQEPVLLTGETLGSYPIKEMAVEVRAIAGSIRTSFSELATLQIGAVLPMSKEGQARLVIDHTTLAFGACGVTGGRLAFRIGTAYESQGA